MIFETMQALHLTVLSIRHAGRTRELKHWQKHLFYSCQTFYPCSFQQKQYSEAEKKRKKL